MPKRLKNMFPDGFYGQVHHLLISQITPISF